jgi:hypothetical protein
MWTSAINECLDFGNHGHPLTFWDARQIDVKASTHRNSREYM